MYNLCDNCNSNHLPFPDKFKDEEQIIEWEDWAQVKEIRNLISGKEKEVSFTKKLTNKNTIKTAWEIFLQIFGQYRIHAFNIDNRYKFYRLTKRNSNANEVLIHIDFAQNYVCKIKEEIQSKHIGASKTQITLHRDLFYCFKKCFILCCVRQFET